MKTEKIENDISLESNEENKKDNKESNNNEKIISVPTVKYTRPPAFVKWNNQFRWNQNNFSKTIQRKSSWRGR
jgi:hypothetical protein